MGFVEPAKMDTLAVVTAVSNKAFVSDPESCVHMHS